MATISDDNRRLDFSDHFVLSSGTVAIDSDRDLVLILYYRPKREYLLPKGRKNVGETLQAAAERETWEESGYTCHLLRHDLPTRTPEPPRSPHTEPIAVQQRTVHGILKLIFWYVAQVDSSDQPDAQTQEEGEDFEVRWVCRKDAPSTMSYEDDRDIVEKALSAVPCRFPGPAQSISPLQSWFLDLSVDVRGLGFLCISLGGSLVHDQLDIKYPQHPNNLTDWDGFGVVEKTEDIIRLVNENKAELCNLLRIEKEECPDMKLSKDSPLPVEWDILRFSGWTKQGSKRTIKIWTKSGLHRTASEATPSRLGVLSYKVVRFTRRCHPILGPRLFVFQPSEATEQLHVLHDYDFLEGPVSDVTLSWKGRSYEAISPGVSCDLFLTSLCLFEYKAGVVASLKAAILRKWQQLSGADQIESIMPLFYRGANFGRGYSQMLRAEIRDMESNYSKDTVRTKMLSQKNLRRSPLSPSDTQKPCQFFGNGDSEYSTGYQGIYFMPLQRRAAPLGLSTYPNLDLKQSFPAVYGIRNEDTAIILTRFSSNSKGSNADIITSANLGWQPVYIKHAESVPEELAALPSVRYHFPNESVQILSAAQPALRRLFFQRFPGETLNEIRLRYCHGQETVSKDTGERSCLADEWFIDIDLRRARDVLAAYTRSFRSGDEATSCAQQRIHAFFYHRLLGNRRLQQFYGAEHPCLFPQTAHGTMSLDAFSDLPLVINGRSYPNLRHHLERALQILNPHVVGGLNSLPTAFGLGDGHGGNVMVSTESTVPSILYVDYEVAGTHSPLLDLAKPIYQDGFFDVAYADFLHDDLTHTVHADGIAITWRVEEGTIHIDYDFKMEPLSKGLAGIKLEYLLRPMLETLDQAASGLRDLAEETLAYGLFACALLTRDYSRRPDVFFLNLAVGVRLATEMRKVFSEFFDWCNWPPHTPIAQESLQLAIRDAISETWRRRMSNLMLSHLLWISRTLEPQIIYLKRETETLSLHRRFSNTPGESASMVIQRISDTRKEAMKIAPHTCIRECLFAEPRIDKHFRYNQVLSDVADAPSKTLIDVGCCMATDIRTLIADGYPANMIIGLDCEKGFIQLGFLLYNQANYGFGAQFREADVLQPRFFEECSDLAGRFDFVHTANVIHLYDEAQQEAFLRALAFLVKPGGLIWGRQVGIAEDSSNRYRQPEGKGARFTVNQFRLLWLAATGWDSALMLFEAILVPYDELRSPRADKRLSMQWSVRAPERKPKGRIVELD